MWAFLLDLLVSVLLQVSACFVFLSSFYCFFLRQTPQVGLPGPSSHYPQDIGDLNIFVFRVAFFTDFLFGFLVEFVLAWQSPLKSGNVSGMLMWLTTWNSPVHNCHENSKWPQKGRYPLSMFWQKLLRLLQLP